MQYVYVDFVEYYTAINTPNKKALKITDIVKKNYSLEGMFSFLMR
jgi:hypothetical protein